MRAKKCLVVFLMVVIACCYNAHGQMWPLTWNVLEDTWTNRYIPTEIYFNSSVLFVSSNETHSNSITLLKFNMDATKVHFLLDSNYWDSIEKATLYLPLVNITGCGTSGAGCKLELYSLSCSFHASATWNCPNNYETLLGLPHCYNSWDGGCIKDEHRIEKKKLYDTTLGNITFDVSQQIKSLRKGDLLISFGLKLDTPGTIFLHSKESGTPPQIIITNPQEELSATIPEGVLRHNITLDGIRVSYLKYASGTKAFLVFLHGIPTSSFMYRKYLKYLAQKLDATAVAYDWVGLGHSSTPLETTFDYSIANQSRLLELFIDSFTSTTNYKKIFLIAHEVGTLATMHYWVHHISRINGIVIFSDHWLNNCPPENVMSSTNLPREYGLGNGLCNNVSLLRTYGFFPSDIYNPFSTPVLTNVAEVLFQNCIHANSSCGCFATQTYFLGGLYDQSVGGLVYRKLDQEVLDYYFALYQPDVPQIGDCVGKYGLYQTPKNIHVGVPTDPPQSLQSYQTFNQLVTEGLTPILVITGDPGVLSSHVEQLMEMSRKNKKFCIVSAGPSGHIVPEELPVNSRKIIEQWLAGDQKSCPSR